MTAAEVLAIQNAMRCLGQIKFGLAIVVAQKRHHTRLVYSNSSSNSSTSTADGSVEASDFKNVTFLNPCPGVCVDATGKQDSIASGVSNDFYLNSHVAIQGTSKPCKYTLVYDDIGLKVRIGLLNIMRTTSVLPSSSILSLHVLYTSLN